MAPGADALAAATPLTAPPTSVDVNTPPPTAPQPEGGDNLTTTIPTQTTPAYQDPEMVMGGQHQSWLAHVMDTVGTIMGGDKTLHVTKHPDGTVEVTHDPSTTGEKWSRIAAAALGGAARGMAAGQGPGGPAKAAAAGIDYGLQQPQQQLDRANQEAAIEQKRIQDHANLVLTQQKLVSQTLANKAAGLSLAKEEQDQSNDEQDRYVNSPNSTPVGEFGSVHEAATSPNTALILKAHPNGTLRTATAFDKDGKITGVHAYVVDRDWGNTRNDEPVPYLEQVATDDPNAAPQFKQKWIPANGDINSKIDTFVTAKNLAAAKLKADWATQQAKLHPAPKTLAEQQLALQQETDPTKKAELQAAINAQQNTPQVTSEVNARNTETELNQAKLKVLQGIGGGAGGTAPGGAKGEEYLQASGIDPSAWNQIRAAANGDVKMPTASRSPQNQAFRNAVMNYDPTFTDARYDTKQNFKTKGDSTSVMQLSTAMAHADRALKSSKVLGNSPSLLTGTNLSGAASAYNSDANFFTGEAGKLAMGGVVGEHEADRIRKQISSPVQSVRDMGLKEILRLTSGKVGAMFQKYKTGAGQELPAGEFFDQPTQRLLTRYGIIQGQGGGGPTPQQIQQQAIAAGVPSDGHAYVLNGKIVGYYEKDGKTYHNLPTGAK